MDILYITHKYDELFSKLKKESGGDDSCEGFSLLPSKENNNRITTIDWWFYLNHYEDEAFLPEAYDAFILNTLLENIPLRDKPSAKLTSPMSDKDCDMHASFMLNLIDLEEVTISNKEPRIEIEPPNKNSFYRHLDNIFEALKEQSKHSIVAIIYQDSINNLGTIQKSLKSPAISKPVIENALGSWMFGYYDPNKLSLDSNDSFDFLTQLSFLTDLDRSCFLMQSKSFEVKYPKKLKTIFNQGFKTSIVLDPNSIENTGGVICNTSKGICGFTHKKLSVIAGKVNKVEDIASLSAYLQNLKTTHILVQIESTTKPLDSKNAHSDNPQKMTLTVHYGKEMILNGEKTSTILRPSECNVLQKLLQNKGDTTSYSEFLEKEDSSLSSNVSRANKAFTKVIGCKVIQNQKKQSKKEKFRINEIIRFGSYYIPSDILERIEFDLINFPNS